MRICRLVFYWKLSKIIALLASAAEHPGVVNVQSAASRWSALHAAAYNGQLNAVKTLLENGARLQLPVRSVDWFTATGASPQKTGAC